ncbi:MAG: TolC family protein [Verrucomicrobia bacterium]|nr:TolC family protein [Verrucomicrobiota bacterium]MCH8528322.1 TolC family protein [Kiritimatiellia bacterium]
MKHILRACAGLGLIAVTAGCRTALDPARPERFEDRSWADVAEENDLPEFRESDAPWWEGIEDEVLQGLILEALEENRELRVAQARIRRARALREESRAGRRPELSAVSGVTRSRTATGVDGGGARTEWDAGLAADWELDVFGRIGRTVEAADARRRIEAERLRDARLRVASEVALAYYQIMGVKHQQRITDQNRELLVRTLELAQGLFDAGETSEFDVVRARGQLQLIEARLPELDVRFHETVYRLSTFLGRESRELLSDFQALETAAEMPDPGLPELPSHLLRRRPDVRAAEEAVNAAAAAAGAARADRFPRFSLLGEAGRRAESASDLGDADSERYRAGLVMNWPIWEGGALRAAEEVRGAELEEAEALYEQQVLLAFADVETALIQYLREREIAERLREAEGSTRRAVELARDLYNAGEENFLSVLDAERELISVQDRRVLSETALTLNRVRLYRAMGGRWD